MGRQSQIAQFAYRRPGKRELSRWRYLTTTFWALCIALEFLLGLLIGFVGSIIFCIGSVLSIIAGYLLQTAFLTVVRKLYPSRLGAIHAWWLSRVMRKSHSSIGRTDIAAATDTTTLNAVYLHTWRNYEQPLPEKESEINGKAKADVSGKANGVLGTAEVEKFCPVSVFAIPCLSDNYAYLVVSKIPDAQTGAYVAICIDVGDAVPVLNFIYWLRHFVLENAPIMLAAVFTTHHHWDHQGGNRLLATHIPNLKILASRIDRVDCCTNTLQDGDLVAVDFGGGLTVFSGEDSTIITYRESGNALRNNCSTTAEGEDSHSMTAEAVATQCGCSCSPVNKISSVEKLKKPARVALHQLAEASIAFSEGCRNQLNQGFSQPHSATPPKKTAFCVRVLHTACHTKGSLIYIIPEADGHHCLFTGDTLFLGGCGAAFEMNSELMVRNFARIELAIGSTPVLGRQRRTENAPQFLPQMESRALLFPGHEYTRRILNEVISSARLRPTSPRGLFALVAALARATHLRSVRSPTVPFAFREERMCNPNFRAARKVGSILQTATHNLITACRESGGGTHSHEGLAHTTSQRVGPVAGEQRFSNGTDVRSSDDILATRSSNQSNHDGVEAQQATSEEDNTSSFHSRKTADGNQVNAANTFAVSRTSLSSTIELASVPCSSQGFQPCLTDHKIMLEGTHEAAGPSFTEATASQYDGEQFGRPSKTMPSSLDEAGKEIEDFLSESAASFIPNPTHQTSRHCDKTRTAISAGQAPDITPAKRGLHERMQPVTLNGKAQFKPRVKLAPSVEALLRLGFLNVCPVAASFCGSPYSSVWTSELTLLSHALGLLPPAVSIPWARKHIDSIVSGRSLEDSRKLQSFQDRLGAIFDEEQRHGRCTRNDCVKRDSSPDTQSELSFDGDSDDEDNGGRKQSENTPSAVFRALEVAAGKSSAIVYTDFLAFFVANDLPIVATTTVWEALTKKVHKYEEGRNSSNKGELLVNSIAAILHCETSCWGKLLASCGPMFSRSGISRANQRTTDPLGKLGGHRKLGTEQSDPQSKSTAGSGTTAATIHSKTQENITPDVELCRNSHQKGFNVAKYKAPNAALAHDGAGCRVCRHDRTKVICSNIVFPSAKPVAET